MKHQSNQRSMEEFIAYKLEHTDESESSARAFNLQRKYQRKLNMKSD